MRWDRLDREACSVARALSVIGDRWTLLVLREAFLRVRRFEEFERGLGITRHILAARLKQLVGEGVMVRVPYQARPKRYEYRLTQKGLDLHMVLMAIVHWGDLHMAGKRGRPKLFEHRACGHLFDPVLSCSVCRSVVTARDVRVLDGPGAPKAADEN
jgi:DNA-binding HxlR family transcriptional regulator